MRRIALIIPHSRFHVLVSDELKRYALKHPDWFIRTGAVAPAEISSLELDALVGFFQTDEQFAPYRSLHVPVIALYRRPTGFRGPVILQKNAEIARQAAAYFISLGLRQFAFVRCPSEVNPDTGGLIPHPPSFWEQERMAAFQKAAQEKKIPCSVSPPYCPVSESLRKPLDAWMEQLPKPAGLLCASDGVSDAIFEACYLRKIPVPEQVSVLGIDNDEQYCALSNPTLSSVAVSMEQIAAHAGQLMETCFQGGRLPMKTIQVGPSGVVERNSTAAVMRDDPVIAEALTMLRHRAHELVNIKEILSSASHSRRQFDRHFQRVVGRTPYEELCRLRVERAKNLLRETQRSITDIAALCGFSGTTHMRRVFLGVTGTAPQDFRSAASSAEAESFRTSRTGRPR